MIAVRKTKPYIYTFETRNPSDVIFIALSMTKIILTFGISIIFIAREKNALKT